MHTEQVRFLPGAPFYFEETMAINGYLETFHPSHPRAKGNGCVYDHILASEEMLGRPLNPHEVVHHKDENRANNGHENLMVMFDKADHARLHSGAIAVKRLDGSYTTLSSRYRLNKAWVKTWYGPLPTKIEWPPVEEVAKLVKSTNFSHAGRVLGVSDNAVRKFLKKNRVS
jgi:hypothetical protein